MATHRINVRGPEALLSYPQLFEPKPGPSGGEAKYSAVFVFEEGSDLRALQKAVADVARKAFGPDALAKIKAGSINKPFRTDWADKGYPENSVFITAKSNTKHPPVCLSEFKDADGKAIPITDPAELRHGAIVVPALTAYDYDVSGNRGVTFGLRGLVKIGDSDKLGGGRPDLTDEFQDFLTEQTAVTDDEDWDDFGEDDEGSDEADLSSLLG